MLPSQSPASTDEELALLPHDDMGPALLAVSWTFVSLASILLGLRVYCKLASRRGLWWDDWILIIAWVSKSPSCPSRRLKAKAKIIASHRQYY